MSHSYAQAQNNSLVWNGKEFFILVRLYKERACFPFFFLVKEEAGEDDGSSLHMPYSGTQFAQWAQHGMLT